jgi:hypothetical protein
MADVVTLVHLGETRKVSAIALRAKCDHFKKSPTQLSEPYDIQSNVSKDQFRLFVDALEDRPIQITPTDYEGLSLLCEELGFNDLPQISSMLNVKPHSLKSVN